MLVIVLAECCLRSCGKLAGRGVRSRLVGRGKKLKKENNFDVNGAKEDDFGVREVYDGALLLKVTDLFAEQAET